MEIARRKDIVYFSIDQGEQAKQSKPENLIARPIFQRITNFLIESLEKTTEEKVLKYVSLDENRAHDAVLLNGGRGTGKTTILVNLSTHIEGNPNLKKDLLILKPVDPTLLENDDDLLLNIIVAALLRNQEVKDAIKKSDDKAKAFYGKLQELGTALEGAQKQKSEFGMEKLRAFIGNHSVGDEVHDLFYRVLDLTGKKLIVLPIDDVDTSLHHAFNNLEVVRRYLASPYVVPIISGDLSLFHELIWRSFHKNFTSLSKEESSGVVEISKGLALEYERKLFPVSRRVDVLPIEYYLSNSEIKLEFKGGLLNFDLVDLSRYLINIVNDGLNNLEGAHLYFSISTIRQYFQLVKALSSELISLSNFLVEIDERDKLYGVINALSKKKFEKNKKYLEIEDGIFRRLSISFEKGAYKKSLYLIFACQCYWQSLIQRKYDLVGGEKISIFSNLLFSPLRQCEVFSPESEKSELRSKWREYLSDVIKDEFWFDSLPQWTLLPYPVPDRGICVYDKISKIDEDDVLCKLMTYSRVYSNGTTENFVFFGRIFEILTLSLFKVVSDDLLLGIFQRPPFYSLVEFSGTKEFSVENLTFERRMDLEFSKGFLGIHDDLERIVGQRFFSSDFNNLLESIVDWNRRNSSVFQDSPSPLLIYRILNKFYTQLSKVDWVNKYPVDGVVSVSTVAELGLQACNSYCAIIGGYHLSDPNLAALDNGFLIDAVTFEESSLYKKNVNSFIKMEDGGSVNYHASAFYLHPVRKYFLRILDENKKVAKTDND